MLQYGGIELNDAEVSRRGVDIINTRIVLLTELVGEFGPKTQTPTQGDEEIVPSI